MQDLEYIQAKIDKNILFNKNKKVNENNSSSESLEECQELDKELINKVVKVKKGIFNLKDIF